MHTIMKKTRYGAIIAVIAALSGACQNQNTQITRETYALSEAVQSSLKKGEINTKQLRELSKRIEEINITNASKPKSERIKLPTPFGRVTGINDFIEGMAFLVLFNKIKDETPKEKIEERLSQAYKMDDSLKKSEEFLGFVLAEERETVLNELSKLRKRLQENAARISPSDYTKKVREIDARMTKLRTFLKEYAKS